MLPASSPDLSIVICSRNRADSLRTTLEGLLRADYRGVFFEVIVVDNDSSDETPNVVDSFRPRMPIRYLFEPMVGDYGKGICLNRALAAESLGQIVAVIDDDITVDSGWFQGLRAICRRWPDYDFFTGPSRTLRDPSTLPGWLRDRRVRGWILSVLDHGPRDLPLRDGGAFSGNHFWFRSSVLATEVRFEGIWNPEPAFYNLLLGRGHKGMYAPDAKVVHRIQEHLLEPSFAIERAINTGISAARMRLKPYRSCIKAARLCHRHPLLGRLFCATRVVGWSLFRLGSRIGARDTRIARRILATQWISYYSEILRLCASIEDYRIFRRSSLVSGSE